MAEINYINGYEIADAQARSDIISAHAETEALNSEINTLSTRMDNFSHLEEGSTTADAEIIDARVGATGQNYLSLGMSIRQQINRAFDQCTNYLKRTRTINMFDKYDIIPYYRVNQETGGITTASNYNVSNYIPVVPGHLIYLSSKTYLAFYDSNKDYVSGLSQSASTVNITIPEGVAYMRISTGNDSSYSNYNESFVVYDSTVVGETGTKRNIPYYQYKYALNDTITLLENRVNTTNYTDILADMNDAISNKIYAIQGALQYILNIPANCEGASGTLFTYTGNPTYNQNDHTYEVQLLVDRKNKLWFRSCWSSVWMDWIELTQNASKNDITPNYANFSAFKNFAVIGDSLTQGSQNNSSGTGSHDFDTRSWAQHIVKMCGIPVVNLGFTGATTTRWINSVSHGLTKALLPENEAEAYIIGLGYNDTQSGDDGVVLGSMDDIDLEDEDNNAISYYGNMDKILRKLHTAYPNAKLFVLNNPYYNRSAAENYNQALKDVTDRLTGSNVYLIDMYGLYNSIYTKLANEREGNHYHKQTYMYMGMLIVTAISNYMLEHNMEFRYVGL